MSEPFIGQLALVAFNYAPEGWLPCNGQLLQVNQYQALYSLLGNTFGGTPGVNFNLPNLQGRVPIHSGQVPGGAGVQYAFGGQGGQENVPLSANQIPPHTHPLNVNNSNADLPNPNGNYLAAVSQGGLAKIYTTHNPDGSTLGPAAIGPNPGGGASHPNMQPYLVLNWMIAVVGIYPTRP